MTKLSLVQMNGLSGITGTAIMAVGRPSIFTKELADLICLRLSEGESLRGICREDEMPSVGTVCRWLATDTVFREQYARAREAQADTLADEILEISDNATNDWMERQTPEGQGIGWQVNGEHIKRSRLRVDSRKWFAGKVAPKKYGEKAQLDLGSDPDRPVLHRVERVIVDPKDSNA